ncbi:N-acyl-aromatic-L-amino acid amidohydrolase (carboxylate-forming) [Pelobates cultripes]|uniref:N-acyl-aromatic-L-amino acid amidohydrolase n=1 Tax=Pelobates cultripes TaxID=61616 RepID=A0AAD1VKD7_PELCU|nr:N-acyl-aromatic-L-amino acid amidohydrolase (carboxylate-forming) [Pelobates cultripes]CAH2222567.1 N-acyl-aromatic-L-amino acid amidohydrolase (carboxylate-forming) [Pelobates cultripes]
MNSPSQYTSINRALIVGGTHGDEMSGVVLAKHWLKDPSELHRKTFTTKAVIGNPLAVERCTRYIDMDLNRSFAQENLSASESESDPYEVKRAREIYQNHVKKEAVDFICDLHNTTSNMGATILLCKAGDHFSLHMANYLQKNCLDYALPSHVYLIDTKEGENIYLQNITRHSLALELGPQPQGVIRADILSRMRNLVNCCLDFIDLFNQGTEFPCFELEMYKVASKVDYPRDADGEIEGIIHKELQDKDYLPLKPGDPTFQTLKGTELFYDGKEEIYPTFINEAAYYEKKVAFIVMQKIHQVVPALKVQG